MGMFEYKKTLSAIEKAHSSVEEVLNEIKTKLLNANEDYFDLEWSFKNVTAASPIIESASGLQFEKQGEGILWGAFITGNLTAYDYGLKVVVDGYTIYDVVKYNSAQFDAFNGIGFMTKSILDTYDLSWNGRVNNTSDSSPTYLGKRYTFPIPQAKSGGIDFIQTNTNIYNEGASLTTSSSNRCFTGQVICKNVSQIVIPEYVTSGNNLNWSTLYPNTRSGNTEVLPMPIKFKNSVKVYGHFRPQGYNADNIGFAMLTSK